MHAPGFLVVIAMEEESLVGKGVNRRGDELSRCPGMAPTPADGRVAHQEKLCSVIGQCSDFGISIPQNPHKTSWCLGARAGIGRGDSRGSV